MRYLVQGQVPAIFKTFAALSLVVTLGGCSGPAALSSLAPDVTNSISNGLGLNNKTVDASKLKAATKYWGGLYYANPNDPQNALNYVLNLKASGDKMVAYRVLSQAVNKHRNHPGLASEFGRLLLESGKTDEARHYLEKAMAAGNPDWRLLSAMGVLSAKSGQLGQAEQYLIQANKMSSNQPTVLNNLAMINAMNKKPDVAETLLRRAMNIKNSNQVASNLAMVQKQAGAASSSVAEKMAEGMEVPPSETAQLPAKAKQAAETAQLPAKAKQAAAVTQSLVKEAEENPANELEPIDLSAQ